MPYQKWPDRCIRVQGDFYVTDVVPPLEADAVSVDGCLLVFDPAATAHTTPRLEDEAYLVALQKLVAAYPGHRIALMAWAPEPEVHPNTCAFLTRRGFDVGMPPAGAKVWDEAMAEARKARHASD